MFFSTLLHGFFFLLLDYSNSTHPHTYTHTLLPAQRHEKLLSELMTVPNDGWTDRPTKPNDDRTVRPNRTTDRPTEDRTDRPT